MNSRFETPISIREVINKIDSREYLLPALQRQFVWRTEQIEVLFDSLMRDYPINSFMLWKVTEPSIKNNLKFYEFLKSYRARYNESNPEFNTIGHNDFFAIIDGQQRLTSIYIGLKGSYAYRMPRKRWRDDEDSIPTRHLYLDLKNRLPDDNERKMNFDFRFLTPTELAEYDASPGRFTWFKVSNILTFNDENALDRHIEQNGWLNDEFTKDTFRQLWRVVNTKPLINYYLEQNQTLATVLDIFIRTNSGGEPLSFSDLLMSVITASWKKLDARKEVLDVIDKVFKIHNSEFQINKDFIVKTCLVLLNDNIRFQIKNFDQTNIVNFEEHWPDIKKAVIKSFELVASFGLTNFSLRAKNALVPIIYFVYHKGIIDEINHIQKHLSEKELIQKWLNISLLKGVFGGQSDDVLTRLRKIIRSEMETQTNAVKAVRDSIQQQGETEPLKRSLSKARDELAQVQFPFRKIVNEFAADPAKNLSFDDGFAEDLLKTQYEDPECLPLLSLLYPHLDYFNQDVHKDHLHPSHFFENLTSHLSEIPATDIDFYSDPNNWNSVLNLQLLNGSLNRSKQDKPLEDWVRDSHIDLASQIIPHAISLDIRNFKEFITKRKAELMTRIRSLV